jgi:CRP-like cAMP-binding protein
MFDILVSKRAFTCIVYRYTEETRIVLVSTMARAEVPAGCDIITQGEENAVRAAQLPPSSDVCTAHNGVRLRVLVHDAVIPSSRALSLDLLFASSSSHFLRENVERPFFYPFPRHTRKTKQTHFFVLESGTATIRIRPKDEDGHPILGENDQVVGSYQPGNTFGELALLYSCPRAATIRAVDACSMWTLERGAYVSVKRTYQQQLALKKRRLVDSVEILAPLSAENRSMLADALQVAPYDAGQYVIKRGEIGNRFYILASGEVAVIGEDGSELSRLKEGSSFGEQALINDDVRKVGLCELRAADPWLESAWFQPLRL